MISPNQIKLEKRLNLQTNKQTQNLISLASSADSKRAPQPVLPWIWLAATNLHYENVCHSLNSFHKMFPAYTDRKVHKEMSEANRCLKYSSHLFTPLHCMIYNQHPRVYISTRLPCLLFLFRQCWIDWLIEAPRVKNSNFSWVIFLSRKIVFSLCLSDLQTRPVLLIIGAAFKYHKARRCFSSIS